MKKITGVIFLVLAMCASTWAQVKITPGAPPGAINSTNVTNVTNNTVTSTKFFAAAVQRTSAH